MRGNREVRQMNLYFHAMTIGRIGIAEENDRITNLYFESHAIPHNVRPQETPLIAEAFRQLKAYLAGDLTFFTVPLALHGTDFMQNVWRTLCTVPYGKTASYKEIAIASGNPTAFRAVGLANNKNPIPIFIPCHRIIGADGKLVGYRGGLDIKIQLLDLEKRYSSH
jgi:methylated-DNA-[protein]-cysteine S-methyltransferase